MRRIAVDCEFVEDGTVRVQRIKLEGRWLSVEQGRQWRDDAGRHVLVMLDGHKVHEIILSSDTLSWELRGRKGLGASVV